MGLIHVLTHPMFVILKCLYRFLHLYNLCVILVRRFILGQELLNYSYLYVRIQGRRKHFLFGRQTRCVKFLGKKYFWVDAI